jgi:hypothetical protein
MSNTAERSTPPGRHASRAVRPGLAPGAVGGALAILIASAALGLIGGLVWAALAPRALYVVVGRGSADVVNPETTAFIAADLWFCLIGAAGGLLIGLAGYLLAVRRYGPVPMGAILAGGLGAGIAARWIGQRQGLGHFNNELLTSHQGTLLHAPLALAGDTSAALWPARGSFPAVAFWPLAAGAVAGGIMLVIAIRERRAARLHPGPLPEPGFRAYPR